MCLRKNLSNKQGTQHLIKVSEEPQGQVKGNEPEHL